MSKFILGKKLYMTQKFMEDGRVAPVTVVEAGPCTITQVKSEKDGYNAVQVGYGKKNKLTKALAGHLKGYSNFRHLKEFRVDNPENFEKGKVFDVSSFKAGDILAVTATSKGKGFQGVVKRHGFHGSPASHGHKDQLRMPGSIGATDPARVFKGTRMGGRMGGDTVTASNLELVEVDTQNNLLFIKGAVPGARNAFVKVVSDGELEFKSPEPEKLAQDKKEENSKQEEVKEDKPEESKEDKQESSSVEASNDKDKEAEKK